ncbi:MAG: transposase [Methanospirillaceae archaeon]|nr:transposase [Methanospirillaceae archaeon]
MVNVEQIEIIKHIPLAELTKKIKDYSIQAKILKRLLFINLRYSGKTVSESCILIGISIATGYTWQERWNLEGYVGLIPKYGGGKPSKMTNQQKEALWEVLHTRDHWSTNEVKQLIQLEFDISYSMDQTRRILRNFNMSFGKPYPHDYRRPIDAEEIFKKKSQK